ncbi:MAG: 30S ribosomal protein S13 [Nanoarchaeota archaeon]
MRPTDASANYKHIVRIANTDLDGRKQIMFSLRKIKGINVMFAHTVCHIAGVDKQKRTGELLDSEVNALDEVIRNPVRFHIPVWLFNRRKDPETGADRHLITSDLTFTRENDIKLMKKVKSYKGLRHQWGLPVRGQRTKSNFRKNKGKGLGVIRKKVAAPQGDDRKK